MSPLRIVPSAIIVLVTVPTSPTVTTAEEPKLIPEAVEEIVVAPNLIVLPLRYKSRNLCVASPKSYATSVLGSK